MALDAKLRVKEARKHRFASYDAKRKGLVEELEARERAFKKARVEKEQERDNRWRENERIMEEGRRIREEREKALMQREKEREEAERKAREGEEPPAMGARDTTIRLKYPLLSHSALTTPSSLASLLAPFGAVDESLILVSLKPAPPKKPKRVTALVQFKQISGAFAAVCASGRKESGLQDVEIDWAEGKEPELIGWLKRMGKLGGEARTAEPLRPQEVPAKSATPAYSSVPPATKVDEGSSASTPFPSFPSTFPDLDALPPIPSAKLSSAHVLDYESVTLMRMRQAERERLEREIREREAEES